MKINWTASLPLAIAIILAGLFVGGIQRNAIMTNRSVEVKGLAEREVPADLAVWPIEVTIASNSLTSLKAQIDGQKNEVIAFFTDRQFAADEFAVGPTNIQDAKANIYGGNPNQPFRYIAKMEFTIRTGDIPKLQKALTASLDLIEDGVLLSSKDNWRPITYMFTGLNDLKPEMIEEATKNAREVAEKFAMDSNSAVGKIKSARQGIFSISDRDQNTPYIKKVRVVTTLDYFLKD